VMARHLDLLLDRHSVKSQGDILDHALLFHQPAQ
jgi:hypothetical protein